MDGKIIVVSLKKFKTDVLQQELLDQSIGEFEVEQSQTIEDANFFDTPVVLLIVDAADDSIFEGLSMVTQDELFRNLPIILILDSWDTDLIERGFENGCLSYLLRPHLHKLLVPQIKQMLLRGSQFFDISIQVSELQQKAIKDFILLDLIKDYIPRTIWNMAEEFAKKQKITLPEQEMDLTLVFADVKGFSTLSQAMLPKEVIENLNIAFDVASYYIYKYNGDIDKYIGDAFFAVFTDPKEALLSMMAMQRAMERVSRAREQSGKKKFIFRVGINNGPVIRGQIGGNKRFDNTLIGDAVNTTQRLESIAQPGGITISEHLRHVVGFDVPEQYRDSIELKGRSGKETVYEVFDYLHTNPTIIEQLPEALAEVDDEYNEAGVKLV